VDLEGMRLELGGSEGPQAAAGSQEPMMGWLVQRPCHIWGQGGGVQRPHLLYVQALCSGRRHSFLGVQLATFHVHQCLPGTWRIHAEGQRFPAHIPRGLILRPENLTEGPVPVPYHEGEGEAALAQPSPHTGPQPGPTPADWPSTLSPRAGFPGLTSRLVNAA
jgi:hypothetical protein